MRLWQQNLPSVALYGAMISPTHVQILLKMGVQKVIYFGDGDEAGQRAKLRAHGFWIKSDGNYRYKAETDLSKHFLMYHVPNHFGKKDAGEMTDKEIISAVNSSERYTPHVKIEKFSENQSIKERLLKIKNHDRING